MVVDDNGRLVADPGSIQVVHHTTVRVSQLAVPTPQGIVWHWTAGRGGTSGWSLGLAKSIVAYDPKSDRAASWHVLIAKDGTIHQSASFLVGTWHVGRPGRIHEADVPNVNKIAVGCELENAGRLLKFGNHFYCWPYYLYPDGDPQRSPELDPHLEVSPDRAIPAEGGWWQHAAGGFFDAYTPAQQISAEHLLRALVAKYGWTPSVCSYGHVMFDFPRKEDPGPLWLRDIMPRLLSAVFPCEAPTP